MSTSVIAARTRMMLQDLGQPFVAVLDIDDTTTVFDLPIESISDEAWPPNVIINNVVISGEQHLRTRLITSTALSLSSVLPVQGFFLFKASITITGSTRRLTSVSPTPSIST